jgi:hypothetical protein
MACQKCKSERIAKVIAKCDDRCTFTINRKEQQDYVPNDAGIGGGDYVEFSYCLDCGQIQNKFPIAQLEQEEETDELPNESDE